MLRDLGLEGIEVCGCGREEWEMFIQEFYDSFSLDIIMESELNEIGVK
jgi:hypothetical protein